MFFFTTIIIVLTSLAVEQYNSRHKMSFNRRWESVLVSHFGAYPHTIACAGACL